MSYQVIDRQTGAVISTHSTRVSASRKADKLDLIYGAVRYGVRATELGASATPAHHATVLP